MSKLSENSAPKGVLNPGSTGLSGYTGMYNDKALKMLDRNRKIKSELKKDKDKVTPLDDELLAALLSGNSAYSYNGKKSTYSISRNLLFNILRKFKFRVFFRLVRSFGLLEIVKFIFSKRKVLSNIED